MSSADPHDLARFVTAQSGAYDTALAELRAGRKRTHWIWYVFPQLRGLGRSAMATAYGIGSRAEALAYLDHPLLGPRLRECAGVVAATARDTATAGDTTNTAHSGATAREIFGSPDDVKVRSSMTLFATAATTAGRDATVFEAVLDRLYGGRPDDATLRLWHELPA